MSDKEHRPTMESGQNATTRYESEHRDQGVTYIDLFDVLPDADVSYDVRGPIPYWKAEDERVTPRLRKAGFEVGGWWTGDGDSFGPLVRCVTVKHPDGDVVVLTYG